jgi:hypothetical protein
MKRLSISLILSIILHVTAVAGIITMQLLQPPKKKEIKIMYINPVKLSELRTLKPEPAKPKPLDKKIDQPKKDIIKKKPEKVASKPVPSPTPYPVLTSPPVEKTPVPVPTKKPVDAKVAAKAAKIEKEQKAKVAFLKKLPYFKKWPEDRLRRLELPPGVKSWEEAKAITDYFDKQYDWTTAPPELETPKPDVNPYEASASPEPSSLPSTVPNPEGTPIPWRLYKEKPEDKIYEVRFYKDNTGFIGVVDENEKEMKITVSYFPFDPQRAKKSPDDPDDTIQVSLPENLKPDEIKHFNLPLTQEDFQTDPEQDLKVKEQFVQDIIKQYELLER